MTTLIEVHTNIDVEMKSEGNLLLGRAKLVVVVLVVLLGLVIAVTYLIVSRQVVRPLRRPAGTADHVAHHDLSANFDPWPAKDEVGDLAQSLDVMLVTMRDRTLALERKTRELESFTYSVAPTSSRRYGKSKASPPCWNARSPRARHPPPDIMLP